MQPVLFSRTLVGANAALFAASQSAAGAQNLTLTGSSADVQRKVAVTSAGNDTGITFTIYGTNQAGNPVQETITGGNAAAVYTNTDFLTVTRVATSGATASTVTVGTNTVGSSVWFMPNFHMTPFSLDINVVVTGSANYNIEYTDDDYFTPTTPTKIPALQYLGTALTATTNVNTTIPFRGWRVTTNVASGTLTVSAIQAGYVNY